MTPEKTAATRPPTIIAGGIIVALAALSNLSTLVAPLPGPVIVIAVVLALAAVAALSGIWMRKSWGRWLGAGTLVATILTAGPGVFFAPSGGLRALAILTVGVAGFGVVLLLLPASRDVAPARGGPTPS